MPEDLRIPSVTGLLFMKLESERVPRKNLRQVGGRPLYCRIFEALEGARHIDRVVLNTDSELIANEVTARFDVTVHMRPEHLLTIDRDEANQIMAYDLSLISGEYFLQTHSTNPLIASRTLDRAVEAFFEHRRAGYDSLLTVTSHRKRFFYVDGKPVNHESDSLKKTQALTPLLEENSCAYVFSRDSFESNGRNRIGRRPFFLEIPAREALDIDTEDDLMLADQLIRARGTHDGR